MVLGSLFDGSGGFPLAGAINGIKPVWASEIEPYPIRVTKARFPNMKHLGSVLDVKGDQIVPVDIITFGSPCQDLSVAGKQKGIHEGERSNLFFEAIRIAKEMRNHDRATGRTDVDIRPRFLVWENVPGAFSSNQGEDFRSVLEAISGIAQDGLSIPRPPNGKWQHAGCVVGDGWSIAWRLYDAQYWGVPQRRKRIYLVADLASERAGEILFERESLCGDPAEGGEAWEGTAEDAEGSTGRSDCHECINKCAAFMGGQGAKAGGLGYAEEIAPTIKSVLSGGNTVPDVVYPAVARTLTAEHDSSPCVDRGQNVVAIDCRNMVGNVGISGTLQAKNEGGFSLNFINPVVYSSGSYGTLSEGVGCLETGTRAVHEMVAVYDARGNGGGKHAPTLTGDHENRVTDYTAICVGNGQLHQMDMGDKTGALNCMHDQQAIITSGKHPRKYIVRRLTPLECCRLQGFPDWWEDGVDGSDSARYKMWGNGIALPCAVDVLRRISKELKKDTLGAVKP